MLTTFWSLTSRAFNRVNTLRAFNRARERYGDEHPATYAAYARACMAWGAANRLRVSPEYAQRVANTREWTVAVMRTIEDGLSFGWDNRAMRKSRVRRSSKQSTIDEIMHRADARRVV